MESAEAWDRKLVINELMKGYDFAKQLESQLISSPGSELLAVQRIVSSFSKSINMLKSRDPNGDPQQADSPYSVSGSPGSENSNRVTFRDAECGRFMSKKRKMEPKWAEEVRVSTGTSLEATPDDGKSWRKYGQKDILGAKYPRAYYRCTHKHSQGCIAKKQVQRSEEDPSIFKIIYQGIHTCVQAANHLIPTSASSPDLQEQQQHQQLLLNFRTGLKVKTEDLDVTRDLNSSSFSFPSAIEDGGNSANCIFSSPNMDNNFMGSFSPPFISPATSESNYFSVSPCHQMNSYGGGPSMTAPESDFNEIISAVTSASNSSFGDLDFRLDDFNPNLEFDASTFLS